MVKNNKNFIRVLILVFLVLGVIAINCRPQKGSTFEKKVVTVEAIRLKLRTVIRTTTLFGVISGEEQVTVMPKIMGRVIKIVKPEGSLVDVNDTILYVYNDLPGLEYQPSPVLAPISGIVGKIYVDPGQMVTQSTPVALISKYQNQVRIKAPISDADLLFVKRGALAKVTVSAFPNDSFTGWVSNVSSIVDPLTGSASIEIVVPNTQSRLIPGMACNINLLLQKKENVLAVPINALLTNQALASDTASVVIADDYNRARIQNVTLGLIGNEWIEIKAGLIENTLVIITGKERVSNGDTLNIIEVSL
jgi:multidrug efflux pump subunit AcrA (membrane-fusion protein)